MTRTVRTTILEVVAVLVIGVVVAALGNALSPRGLSWTRNYAPARMPVTSQPVPTPAEIATALPTPTQEPDTDTEADTETLEPVEEVEEVERPAPEPPAHNPVAQGIIDQGFGVADFDMVHALYHDPLYEAGGYVFVDARNDQHYREGHIPGAHQLDYYYVERYIEPVLEAGQFAEIIVVYCSGGNCEDSEFAAMELATQGASLGIVPGNIHVYLGGINEWKAQGQPVERGARGSGDIVEPSNG